IIDRASLSFLDRWFDRLDGDHGGRYLASDCLESATENSGITIGAGGTSGNLSGGLGDHAGGEQGSGHSTQIGTQTKETGKGNPFHLRQPPSRRTSDQKGADSRGRRAKSSLLYPCEGGDLKGKAPGKCRRRNQGPAEKEKGL